MERKQLAKKGREDGRIRAFRKLGVALLASAALGGCKETVHYSNDSGRQDGGADAGPDSSRVSDTMDSSQDTVGDAVREPLCSSPEAHVSLARMGESLIFPNEYSMTLTGITGEIAFFSLNDGQGGSAGSAEMEEGLDVLLPIPGNPLVAACAVDGSAGTAIVYSADRLAIPSCEVGAVTESEELSTGFVIQRLTITSEVDCHGTSRWVGEVTDFVPYIAAIDENGGFFEPGRYSVRFMGEDYLLLGFDQYHIVLGKESAGGRLMPGEAVPYGDGALELIGVAMREGALQMNVRLQNAAGIPAEAWIPVGDTAYVDVGGLIVPVHAYSMGEGATPDEGWADLGIIPIIKTLQEGIPQNADGFRYLVNVYFTPGAGFMGWRSDYWEG